MKDHVGSDADSYASHLVARWIKHGRLDVLETLCCRPGQVMTMEAARLIAAIGIVAVHATQRVDDDERKAAYQILIVVSAVNNTKHQMKLLSDMQQA
jgi:hypothetical protein